MVGWRIPRVPLLQLGHLTATAPFMSEVTRVDNTSIGSLFIFINGFKKMGWISALSELISLMIELLKILDLLPFFNDCLLQGKLGMIVKTWFKRRQILESESNL